MVAVISAMSGVTDKLIGLAHQVMDNPPERELDMLLATGEQQSIALLCMAIADMGYKARSFTGAQAGITTYGSHTRGRIESIDPKLVVEALEEGCIVVCAGFQGVDKIGTVYTLGRGGSDLSAIAMAAAVKAEKNGDTTINLGEIKKPTQNGGADSGADGGGSVPDDDESGSLE